MTTPANAVFEVKTWNEEPYEEINDGSKLTKARTTKVYRGDITGDATSEALMFYRADGSAAFTGFERLTGAIGERTGAFVLQFGGIYRNGAATGDCTVVPDSGSGELRGLRGHGRYVATHADYPNVRFTLDYSFE